MSQTMGENCASCGAAIDNTAVTGLLCESCYEKEQAPPPSWKDAMSPAGWVAAVAVILPFFVTFHVNNLIYTKLGGGAVGLLAGAVALLVGLRDKSAMKGKKVIAGGIFVLVALYHLLTCGIL